MHLPPYIPQGPNASLLGYGIHRMRAPGLTWSRLPLFVWAHYATSIIQILGTQRLPRLVGKAKALEMLVAAEKLHAAEALRIGLVDAVVEDPAVSF